MPLSNISCPHLCRIYSEVGKKQAFETLSVVQYTLPSRSSKCLTEYYSLPAEARFPACTEDVGYHEQFREVQYQRSNLAFNPIHVYETNAELFRPPSYIA